MAEEAISYLLEEFYPKTGVPISAAHPAFLIDHVVERCRFQGIEPRIDVEFIRDAAENLMVEGEPPPIRRRAASGSPLLSREGSPAKVRHRAGSSDSDTDA